MELRFIKKILLLCFVVCLVINIIYLPFYRQASRGRSSTGPNQYSGSQVSTELPYEFADPCPESMRAVNIADLSSVNINWKMLTLARPDNKTDEEIFSK